MQQGRVVLFIAAIILIVGTVADAATQEELEVIVRRLEQRVAAQDDKIAAQQRTIDQLKTSGSKQLSEKQRREEIRKIFKEMKADAGAREVPGWLENFTIYGDLRLRYHLEKPDDHTQDKHRGRFRLRVGAKKTWLDKQLEVGFRLASGSSDDPTSTNQTFTGNFSEKQVWIDLAYAKYQPKALKGFMAVGGKMKNPFVHTNMIWDSDVNPEGVWVVYRYGGLGPVEPFAGFGFFQLDHNSDAADATLHAYQAGATWKVTKDVKWTAALAYYDYGHYEDHFSRAKSNTEVGGYLTAEEFNVLNLTNKVSWKAFNLPMSAYVDYAHNCGNELGGQSDAFAVGYKVGKNKKKGDWSASYKYAYIQANATPAAFNDSDFGNTNRKGHQWGAKYNLLDSVTAGVNLFCTEPISGDEQDETQFLVLGDLIWKF